MIQVDFFEEEFKNFVRITEKEMEFACVATLEAIYGDLVADNGSGVHFLKRIRERISGERTEVDLAEINRNQQEYERRMKTMPVPLSTDNRFRDQHSDHSGQGHRDAGIGDENTQHTTHQAVQVPSASAGNTQHAPHQAPVQGPSTSDNIEPVINQHIDLTKQKRERYFRTLGLAAIESVTSLLSHALSISDKPGSTREESVGEAIFTTLDRQSRPASVASDASKHSASGQDPGSEKSDSLYRVPDHEDDKAGKIKAEYKEAMEHLSAEFGLHVPSSSNIPPPSIESILDRMSSESQARRASQASQHLSTHRDSAPNVGSRQESGASSPPSLSQPPPSPDTAPATHRASTASNPSQQHQIPILQAQGLASVHSQPPRPASAMAMERQDGQRQMSTSRCQDCAGASCFGCSKHRND